MALPLGMRLGLYVPGDDNPREQWITHAAGGGIVTAIRAIFSASPPAPNIKIAIRNQITLVAGAEWEDETPEWFVNSCYVLFSDGQDEALRLWLRERLLS